MQAQREGLLPETRAEQLRKGDIKAEREADAQTSSQLIIEVTQPLP